MLGFLNSISKIFKRLSDAIKPFTSWVFGNVSEIPGVAILYLIIGICLGVGLIFFIKYIIEKEKKPKKERPVGNVLYKLPPVGGWLSEYLTRRGIFKVGRIAMDFLNSLEFLEQSLKCNNYKYKNPWILTVGAKDSGKTSFLRSLYSNNAKWQLTREDKYNTECNWFFLKDGVALDVTGDFFLAKDKISSDEVGWNAVRNLLTRYRSAKPIDSILLTISAEDLYGKKKLESGTCLSKAKFMAQKLNIFQDSVGLKIPIYVVITKTDLIPGFQDFCKNIPIESKQNIFGWSNPFSTDTAFTPAWIDFAINSVIENVRKINMDISCDNVSWKSNDSLFVFPYELEKIQENLLIYLNNIFKIEQYQTPLLLRGIYFSGDGGTIPIENSSMQEIDAALLSSESEDLEAEDKTEEEKEKRESFDIHERLFFCSDLINSKILLEGSLCIPQKGFLLTANKSLKIAKISTGTFVVVSTIGVYNAYNDFYESKSKLLPALSSMSRFLVKTQRIPLKELSKKNAAFEDAVKKLSSIMINLSNTNLSSIFIPASLFSPLKSKLNASINLAYQSVIMRALYVNLLLKARELLNMKPEDIEPTNSIAALALPTKSNEFKAMNKLVTGIDELINFVDKFNDLRIVPSSKVLAELVEYAFKMTLSEPFLEHYKKIKGKLSTSSFPAIDLAEYKGDARKTLNDLFELFFNTIFVNSNPKSFPAQLEKVIRQLRHIDSHGLPEIEFLRTLGNDLDEVVKQFDPSDTEGSELQQTKPTWMDEQMFNPPGEEFENFLCAIDGSRFFGKEISQSIVDNCALGLFHLKRSLKEITFLLTTDPKFAQTTELDNDPRAFSKGLILLGKSIKKLFNEPYMLKPTGHKFVDTIPEGYILYWDDKLLSAACELCKQYENFCTKNVGSFPVVLQESMRLLARDGLQKNIISLVAQSQNFVALPSDMHNRLAIEELIRSQTSNVRLVYPQFLKLLELLNYESVSFFYVNLRELLLTTNYWLLNQINDLMKVIGPYHIWDPSFSWWNGEENPAYRAYGEKDSQGLNSFLDIQSKRVLNLAIDFAKPVIDFLTSSIMLSVNPIDKNQLTKWKRIVEQADAFQRKQPGNSIAELESFITTTLKTYTIDNVFEQINFADLDKEVGDHFLETIQFLKLGILGRSEILVRKKNIKNYKELADFFNKHLQGRFPFTPPSSDPSQSVEVDPEDFRAFMNKFKAFGGSAQKILEQIYQLGNVANDVVTFLKRVEALYYVFQDYLDNDYGGLPSVSYVNEFGVNQANSVGDNYVVSWAIQSNDDAEILNTDKNKKTKWVYGAKTSVGFKWPDVKGLMEVPINDPSQPFLHVLDKLAGFVYVGNWSLFRMIRKHRANKGEYLPMANPNTIVLKFTVPLSVGKSAILFNSISFVGASPNPNIQGKVLELPDFPIYAPDFSPELEKIGNEPVLSFGIIKPSKTVIFSNSIIENKAPVDNNAPAGNAPAPIGNDAPAVTAN